MEGIALISGFLLLVLLRVPMAVCMGLTGGIYFMFNGMPPDIISQRMLNSLNSYTLLAVPIFILAGNLLNTAGISTRIFQFARAFFGHREGGLAQVCVVTNLIFSGVSGAALADLGALGNIEMKAMKEQGYRDEDGAAIAAATATIGPIFPPSIPLIIFAAVAEVSGVKLLISGVIPALIIVVMFFITIAIMARIHKYPKDTVIMTGKEKWAISRDAFASLMAPVILLVGLLTGYFSPTEVAAVCAAYAVLIGVIVYREMTWKGFVMMVRETVRQTGNIMFIIAAAAIFSLALTMANVPDQLNAFFLGVSKDPLVLMLMVNLLLLVVGMFMETIAALLILTPILVPTLAAVGVDPIQLGLVVVLNLMIGLLTPPVGMSLYLVSIMSGVSFPRICKAILPYYIPLLATLALVTVFPVLTVWLPNLVYAK